MNANIIPDNDRLDVEELIPHRQEMLLIGRIIDVSAQSATAEAVVGLHWPTARPEGIDALVLIELVAQTAGLSVGWKIKQRRSDASAAKGRGWMVGVKAARFTVDPIAIDTRLTIETQIAFEFEQLTEISGRVHTGQTLIAEVRLQVVHEEPP